MGVLNLVRENLRELRDKITEIVNYDRKRTVKNLLNIVMIVTIIVIASLTVLNQKYFEFGNVKMEVEKISIMESKLSNKQALKGKYTGYSDDKINETVDENYKQTLQQQLKSYKPEQQKELESETKLNNANIIKYELEKNNLTQRIVFILVLAAIMYFFVIQRFILIPSRMMYYDIYIGKHSKREFIYLITIFVVTIGCLTILAVYFALLSWIIIKINNSLFINIFLRIATTVTIATIALTIWQVIQRKNSSDNRIICEIEKNEFLIQNNSGQNITWAALEVNSEDIQVFYAKDEEEVGENPGRIGRKLLKKENNYFRNIRVNEKEFKNDIVIPSGGSLKFKLKKPTYVQRMDIEFRYKTRFSLKIMKQTLTSYE